jgi:hypothetical protein
MPLPDNSYYALFPIQEQIIDSTNGLPLADGTVTFYRDTNRSVPKDVYQRTENPDNTFTYVNLGSELVLSSIGTYTDPSGNNIIPFLWPFLGLPTDPTPSTVIDLYFIKVVSSGGIEEFTVSAWPPEVSGGSSTANTTITSTNVISNPQFAVINYPSPYTITVSGNMTTKIAPDWDVITSGSGSFTISQIAETDTRAPGLPAFGLRITLAGISALLSQKISMSPRILETGYASGTFIAQSNLEAPAVINMNFVPSDPALTTATLATLTAANGSYSVVYGAPVDLSAIGTNPDSGSVGYVNIQLALPIGSDVSISCVQLVSVPNATISPTYIQDPTTRQIDHIYHDAYPIVPVGTIIDFGGFNAPAHYLLCDGTAYANSRVLYNQLYRSLTLSQVITQASTTTFVVTSAAQLGLGMFVEGPGITVGTYITIIAGTTITVNQVTTSTGAITAIFYAWGQGDGSTTFNVPDLTGQVLAATGANLVAISPLVDALGQFSIQNTPGLQNLLIANLPNHNHPGSSVAIGQTGTGAAGSGISGTNNGPTSVTVAPQGTGTLNDGTGSTPFSIVQPTTIVYKYIRYE